MLEPLVVTIDTEEIPYQFLMEFGGDMFEFTLKYNAFADIFTLDVSIDGEDIVYGVPINYGVPVFSESADERLQAIKIKAYDVAGQENRVTFENINETVFLYVEE